MINDDCVYFWSPCIHMANCVNMPLFLYLPVNGFTLKLNICQKKSPLTSSRRQNNRNYRRIIAAFCVRLALASQLPMKFSQARLCLWSNRKAVMILLNPCIKQHLNLMTLETFWPHLEGCSTVYYMDLYGTNRYKCTEIARKSPTNVYNMSPAWRKCREVV